MIGLIFIRNLYNMSMDELAEKLGVSKQTISKWENCLIPISKNRLKQLAELFNTEEKYFYKKVSEKALAKINYTEIIELAMGY